MGTGLSRITLLKVKLAMIRKRVVWRTLSLHYFATPCPSIWTYNRFLVCPALFTKWYHLEKILINKWYHWWEKIVHQMISVREKISTNDITGRKNWSTNISGLSAEDWASEHCLHCTRKGKFFLVIVNRSFCNRFYHHHYLNCHHSPSTYFYHSFWTGGLLWLELSLTSLISTFLWFLRFKSVQTCNRDCDGTWIL